MRADTTAITPAALDSIRAASTKPLIVSNAGLMAMLSASKSTLHRMKSTPGFPAALDLPGGPYYRVVDVERWIGKVGRKK